MRIQRLYIGDFGIFRNQALDELAPGLVVIGGPNRSGKTTFMQILRYLGFGFPQGANLPPPTHEYHVEAVVEAGNELWNIRVNGYGKPRVSGPQGQTGSIERLFGGLDVFTYHQLFTISLDELRLLPEGLDKSEKAKLQSVLLGAGLAHAARLPKLRDELEAEAGKIGGKLGNPSVKMFKPYYNQLALGIKQRDNALAEMDGYRARVERLADIEARIEELKEKQYAAAQRAVAVDILLRNFEDYSRWVELGAVLSDPKVQRLLSSYPDGLLEKARILQENYETAAGEYEAKLSAFSQRARGKDAEAWMRTLLDRAEWIERASRNLSGIAARISAYEKRREAHKAEEQGLEIDVRTADSTWRGGFERLERIVVQVDEDELRQTADDYQRLKEADGIIQRLRQLDAADFGKQFRGYAFGAALVVLLGTLIGLVLPPAGIGLAVAGVVGLGILYMYRTMAGNVLEGQRRSMMDKLQEIAASLEPPLKAVDGDGFQKFELRRQQAETRLGLYRDILGLTAAADGQRCLARLAEFKQLWQRYKALERQREALDEELQAILPGLDEMSQLAGELGDWNGAVEPTAASFNCLATAIEKAYEDLQAAREAQAAENKLAEVTDRIAALVQECPYLEQDAESSRDPSLQLAALIRAGEERVKYQKYAEERAAIAQRIQHSLGRREDEALKTALAEAAAARDDDGKMPEGDGLEVLGYLYREYRTPKELEECLRQADEDSQRIDLEIKQLEEERAELKRTIAALDTDQTLAEAQRAIDEARAQLEPLARKFAVQRVAAFFLDTLYREFLAEARGSLLSRASEIFRELTQGDYEQILPMDDLTEAGFQVTAQGGREFLPHALSRGTSEQLFLAVRLGRILEIEPPLPVIFDDSLVNFDRRHAYQAVRALERLARRHQVFVLTCHPELIEMVADVQEEQPVQYWQLDRGVFSLVDGESLVRFLAARVTA